MKNIFITRRKHNIDAPIEKRYVVDDLGRSFLVEDPIASSDVEVTDSLDYYHEIMRNHDEFGLDTENSDLNQFYAIPLLLQIAIPGVSFVIDQTSIKEDYLSQYNKKLFIGHNIQYDYRIIKYHMGVELYNLEDTMITEQILNRGSGRLNNLEDTYLRRCNKHLPEDKKTRNDFIRMTEKSIFERKHIVYAGFDPQTGLEIREVQKPLVKENKLEFRVYGIGMPLIPILGDMNLNGITLDKVTWKENLETNKKEKFKLELELDKIVKEFSKDNAKLRGGIWSSASRIRKKEEGEQIGLFGENTSIATEATKNIAYSSTHQLAKLFTILKEPLPETEDREGERDWENPAMKVSFGEPVLEQYKILYPSSKMIPFINLLLRYKEVDKEINSFGEIFLKEYIKSGKSSSKRKRGYFQPKTNKVHTVYKQEFTANGRLASGGDVKQNIGFFNSQQIPKKNKFRNCFVLTQQEIDEGWFVSTSDLSAAELVILASKSQDPNLMKYCKEDLHSYLATHSYTRTIQYIIDTMASTRAYDEIYQLLRVNRLQRAYKIDGREPTPQEIEEITKERVTDALIYKGIIIDKKKYPDIRDPYKNVTYGITYGAAEDKIAKTLNIASYYAKLVMEGVKIAIPQAMAYLETVARKAVKEGYVVFNERTGSRHIFKSSLDATTYGRQLSNAEKGSIERFTKNAHMSGTQSDCIKEAMIEIDKYVRANNIEFQWLLQVHDELVYKHKNKELRSTIEKIMTDTCNLYLKNITMEVSGATSYCWSKD